MSLSSLVYHSSNPIPDEELTRSTEDLSSTGPTVTDRHIRALTAVSAYGASVALNKTRQRPVSAKIASTQGEGKMILIPVPLTIKYILVG